MFDKKVKKNSPEQARDVDEATLDDAMAIKQEIEEVREKHKMDKIVSLDEEVLALRQDLKVAEEKLQVAEASLKTAEAAALSSEEKAKIALADYQNLVRRTQEDRVKFVQMAGQDFAEGLLEPLRNLSLAAEALNDQGLNMVIGQLWAALQEQGLEEMNADLVGKKFDVETMEAVEKEGDGKGDKVVKVVTPGYKMNERVIQHAKVVVG